MTGGRSLLCWLHLLFKHTKRSQYIPIAKKGFACLAKDLSALSALVNQVSNFLKCREIQSLRTFPFVTESHCPGPKEDLRGEGRIRVWVVPKIACSLVSIHNNRWPFFDWVRYWWKYYVLCHVSVSEFGGKYRKQCLPFFLFVCLCVLFLF